MQNDILDFIRTPPTASRKEVTDNIANSTEDGIWNVLSEGYEQEI
jgi:hypothetical protein